RESRERALAEERHRVVLEQFGHVARTSTIGEMATGLAHELNQPLGAIANYTEGCLVALESTGPETLPVREALRKVLATTLRAGQIVSRIRRFVTRHEPIRESVDPNRLVADVEEFVRDEVQRHGISLETRLASDLPWVWADPVQIQQVLVNLVRNAVDASLAAKVQAPSVVMWTRIAPSGRPELGVTDHGEGIPDDRFAQIFDAYFSTRAQGMGMGLAISRTIVEGHGSRIDVESEPGVRTTFRFTLRPAGVDDAGTDGLRRRR
ncbi:sensor histidine kinase, partial [Singulisphaera rosea]